MKFDVSEVRRLEHDLGKVSDRAAKRVRETMQKAALNIKKDMQGEATGSESFARVRYAITYETRELRDSFVAEVGPEIGHDRGDPKGQGGLAWIAYNGYTGRATTPPQFPDPMGALQREADAFEAYLAAAVAGDFW